MFYNEKVIKLIVYMLYALCAGLILVDVIYHKHGHFAFEEWFGFYAVYGFISCLLIVFVAVWFRKYIKRDEDYYD